MKSGDFTRITEAMNMEFVRQHTSIPMPKVYNTYQNEETGLVRIVMERLEGEQLGNCWDSLTVDEKESIISQLKGYFAELQQIGGPYIGNVDGSFCDR